MACEIVESTGAVFVLWGRPNRLDFARAFERLRAAVKRNGGKVVFVTRVPDGAPPPDAETRKYLNQLMPSVIECCSSYHVIMEGTGFLAALKRGVLVSLFRIGQRRGMFYVHSSGDEVVRAVGAENEATVRSLLNRARSQGLLDGNPLVSLMPNARNNLRQTG